MKKLSLIIFLITSLLLTNCTLATRSKVIVLTKENPSCTIRLPSNPTTGYSWTIQAYDTTLLQLKRHYYISPETGLIGAGGEDIWEFEATPKAFETAPHRVKIRLIYARSWEMAQGKEPANIKTVKIMIQK